MARIRSIKPEFFTSLKNARLPVTARLTFIGLWTHADDEGRCPDEPRLIKAALWPLDDKHTVAKVEVDLKVLAKDRRIIRYASGGERWIAVVGWQHQRIDKPRPSEYPAPPAPDHSDEEGTPNPGSFQDASTNDPGGSAEPSGTSRAPADRIIGSLDRGSEGIPLERQPSADNDPPQADGELVHLDPKPHPTWQRAITAELGKIDQTGSWNLVDAYADAWDTLVDEHRADADDRDPWPDLIGLTCGFVAQVVGQDPPPAERGLIAMTVRKHGKAALLGWDRSLGTTETDSARDRFRYARGVINRFIAELEPAR